MSTVSYIDHSTANIKNRLWIFQLKPRSQTIMGSQLKKKKNQRKPTIDPATHKQKQLNFVKTLTRKSAFNQTNLKNKAFPNPASRMIGRVLILSQFPSSHKRDCHRISENHLDRRRSNRRQIKRTQFPLQRKMHVHIASVCQGIVGDGSNRNEITPLGSSTGDETDEFFSGARFRKEDKDVGSGERANVAVEGVERGEESGADTERN